MSVFIICGFKALVPRSLRTRLTLSYATVIAILLAIIVSGASIVCFQRYVQTEMLAIDTITSATRHIVRMKWTRSDADLMRSILRQELPSGVSLTVHASRPNNAMLPPDSGQLPANGVEAKRIAAGFPAGFPLPGPSLDAAVGLHPRIVWLHRGDVIIRSKIATESLLALGFVTLAIALTVACSWGIGRWLAAQAILPLLTVTHELRRFASGDFEASDLESRDDTELGELVAAYNGAAAQVVAAFSERERTERHLRVFLGKAGHEMRTPLTVISAYLDVLDTSGPDNIMLTYGILATLRGETRRLRELVERVMDLARMEASDSGGLALLDVAESARDAIDHVNALDRANVRISSNAGDVVVLAEPWALREAIGNLVSNAIRYGEGTPVDLSIDLEREHVVVRVRDRGPGVSDADRIHLFRHFFRGARSNGKPGSGLGLAIVARAAERLGGSVALEHSSPNDTVFTLKIPTYRPPQLSVVRS